MPQMKKIEFCPPNGAWTETPVTDQRSASAIRFRHEGDKDRPQMFEVKFGPNEIVGAHAHYVDEVIYVLEGSILFGQRVLGPGASVSVPANVLYSFKIGPHGAHYLNFRGTRDLTNFNREQLAELLKLEGAAQHEYVRAHTESQMGQYRGPVE